jgi:hypothetical protein
MIDPYRMIVISVVASLALILGLLFYRYIFPKKRINLFLLLVIISFLPLISILRKGGYESGDLSIHVVVAMGFFDNLKQWNILPAWFGTGCSGYGCPSYIFIYQLPYYLVSFFHLLSFSFINSIKIVLAISFLLSGIGMFLWIKKELGEKPAFVAAIFYLFAPYHLIDLHFRVSLAEVVSMAILPFLFLTTKLLIQTGLFRYFLYTSCLFALLLLSHQVTSFVSFPLLVIYGFAVWIRKDKRKFRRYFYMLFAYVTGFFLAAYYLIPIFLENKFVHYSAEKIISFMPFFYFLYSPDRLGLLFQGHMGELYTIVGYTQWIVLFIGFYILLQKKNASKDKILLGGSLIIFTVLFLMMQSFTKPIWDTIPFIKNFQFSWRLMIECIFVIAVIAGIVVKRYKGKTFFILLCFFTIAYTILNWGNRKAVSELNDAVLMRQEILKEYPGHVDVLTPKWVDINKAWIGKGTKGHIEVLNGNAEIAEVHRSIEKHEYVVQVKSKVVIKENTYYFPGWKVLVDEKETKIDFKNKQYPGVITFNLDKGLHKVELVFTDTIDRMIGKWISGVTIITLGCVIFFRLVRRFFPKR